MSPVAKNAVTSDSGDTEESSGVEMLVPKDRFRLMPSLHFFGNSDPKFNNLHVNLIEPEVFLNRAFDSTLRL